MDMNQQQGGQAGKGGGQSAPAGKGGGQSAPAMNGLGGMGGQFGQGAGMAGLGNSQPWGGGMPSTMPNRMPGGLGGMASPIGAPIGAPIGGEAGAPGVAPDGMMTALGSLLQGGGAPLNGSGYAQPGGGLQWDNARAAPDQAPAGAGGALRHPGGPSGVMTPAPPNGGAGGNMTPGGLPGGPPPGWVLDTTRTGGVRPWDAPGFDPTHGGPFYRPGPDASTPTPATPGTGRTPGQTPGIVPPIGGARPGVKTPKRTSPNVFNTSGSMYGG